MKATKAKEIFRNINKPPTLKERLKKSILAGEPALSVPKMNENDPQLKKLEKKGYLITHTNSSTYICWTH
jgi:hypothetical protein